ncbi:unnamed protein product [Polarella glacialis]|uniref:Alpha/beta hydrolase fold-5 domain-containing protein n=1 Tax=Polarella glacialis TaxID=89957 RepID=A0A813IM90_POLGL|nr:unnamed protein product [Polarella glacialis]CAE8653706.1 unnamed protein product [Polarella glacialis]
MWWPWLVLLAIVALVLCACLAMAATWYKHCQEPFESAFAALSDTGDGVEVQEVCHGRVFLPTQQSSNLGLVYLPGALVDARAYAPLCRDIAKRTGCAVVLLDMPMRMANFGMSRISQAMREVTSVTRWAIGRHSLGGAVAVKFFMNAISARSELAIDEKRFLHAEVVALLLHTAYLWASVGVDLSGRRDIFALQVLAENDGVIDKEKVSEGKAFLPADGVTVTIEGGNHAGFGHYGPQTFPRLDGVSTIGLAEQQTQVADATVDWLKAIDQRPSGTK